MSAETRKLSSRPRLAVLQPPTLPSKQWTRNRGMGPRVAAGGGGPPSRGQLQLELRGRQWLHSSRRLRVEESRGGAIGGNAKILVQF